MENKFKVGDKVCGRYAAFPSHPHYSFGTIKFFTIRGSYHVVTNENELYEFYESELQLICDPALIFKGILQR